MQIPVLKQELLNNGEAAQLPEVAYVGSSLCFVRTIPAAPVYPLPVTFAFTPWSFADAGEYSKALAEIDAMPEEDARGRIEANARLFTSFLASHVKAWSLRDEKGVVVPITEDAIAAAPGRVVMYMWRALLESGSTVDDAEKKSDGSSDSPPSIAAGSNSTVPTA